MRSLLAVFALASCAPAVDPVSPAIAVDACAQRVEQCAVTYTSIPSTQLVRITNPSAVELRLFSVETTNGTFSLEEVAPSTLQPGLHADIAVTASSRSANGELHIISDADNVVAQQDGSKLVTVALIVR